MPRSDSSSPIQPKASLARSPKAGDDRLIIAGGSTSPSSRAAVRWAAVEAERRQTGLCIVHAYPLPHVGQTAQRDVDHLLRSEATVLVERIAGNTRREHPHLEITTRLIQGPPVNALRDESVGAALTVIGATESGRLARAILGSIASAIASANPAPVAVVHPDHPANGAGPVVVGIDGSAGNTPAVEFAFAEATTRDTQLIAVHTWNPTVLEGDVPDYPSVLAQASLEQDATAVLSENLTGWRKKYPDVAVTPAVHRGKAATILLEYGRSASLVVVGQRPRKEFEALIMGSTSRSLISHSPCPVVIVRSRETDQ